MIDRLKPFLLWYGLAALFLFVCLTTIRHTFPVLGVRSSIELDLFKLFLLALTPVAAWLALSSKQISPPEQMRIWILCMAAAGLCEVVHYWVVDKGHFFRPSMYADNTSWQLTMHRAILRLDPVHIPHSYRFLPDAFVDIFQRLSGDFEWARTTYRLLANSLLFVVVYRYARVYVGGLSAAGVLLSLVVVYPVTILKYAGQFTDPASHLSFAVCLYCLAVGFEAGFGPALFLGILAKESVLVMALCRAFYGSHRLKSCLIAAVYLAVGFAIAAEVRLIVNAGSFGYSRVSGVEWPHVWTNLGDFRAWLPMYVFSLGVFLPGTVLAWKSLDGGFKASAVLLTVSLIASSAVFSWLVEVRNLVPAFIPLSVATVKYVEGRLDQRS